VNDECTSPVVLSNQSFCTAPTHGSTAGATPSIPNGSCHAGEYDTWYSFVATSTTHKILVDADPGFTYISGEVFKENCSGEPISCFNEEIFMPDGIAILDELEIDTTYFIRVAVHSPSNLTGEFSICLSSPPANDYCKYATVLIPNSTNTCTNSIPGTTINATLTLGRQNVWYLFTAVSKNVTIVVTPSTLGFDPGIKLWNPTTGITLDNCVFDTKITNDEVHVSYAPEILSLSDLTIGNTYYVEVYTNTDNLIPGDFEICMYSPEDKMTVYSAVSETYPFDTVVSAGTYNEPVTKVTLQMTGRLFNKVIRKINFDVSGTTDMNDVLSASVFIDTKVWGFHNSAILPYKPFGKVGEGLSEYPPPFLFGTPINHPGVHIEFNGEYIVEGERYSNTLNGSDNYPRFIYLVMEVACDADPGHVIKAICNSITFEADSIIPILGNTDPLSIVPLDSYDTRSDGQWNDGATWVCGAPPPHNPASPPTNIYHRVMLTDTADVGSVNIYYQRALELTDEAQLTMGASSMGANTGNANKLLSCLEGSLLMDHATLNINGGFTFGTPGGELNGNGLCCNNGSGAYSLSVGGTVITRDSNFVSIDYFPFCVEDGHVVNVNNPAPQNETELSSPKIFTSSIELFKQSFSRNTSDIPAALKNYTLLEIDTNSLRKIMTQQPDQLSMTIPFDHRNNLVLELEESNSFLSNTIIRSAPDMNVIELPQGIHYRGKIKGDPKSIVALSFFDNEVIGMISSVSTGTINLGKKKNSNNYIAYNDHQVKEFFGFTCTTSDDGYPYTDEQIHFKAYHRSSGDCIGIYIEVNNDIVTDKGGIIPAANFITAIFNQVALLYANENISIQLSEMTLWTGPSPYTQNTLGEVFEEFKSIRTSFNGDLGLLVSYNFSAGYAQLNGLCRTEQKYSTGYVGLFSTYLNIPVYSWSVEVMAHELGHLFNSRHTHACSWNGNQTAIDGCYTPEGSCDNINTLPENGGTIMSYCHLTDAGINFAEGFGIQPGNVMRYAVDHSACTQNCVNQSCTMNDISVNIRTDAHPTETVWHLEDAQGKIMFTGGPYIQSNHTFIKQFCVPDGCYRLIMTDAYNTKPGGTLIAKDSKIILDGNDGVNPATNSYFKILTSNIYTDHLNITMLDPGLYFYYSDNSIPQNLNGTLTFGGGDDAENSTGFQLNIGPGGSDGFMTLDSLIISGGYASQNRHVFTTNSFITCKNIWIKPLSEFGGGIAITHDFRNDGLYTGWSGRNLSFCGSVSTGHQYPNITTTQRMYGTGLVRALETSSIPSSQIDNQINMLRVDNTFDGLNLEMPLGILNTLRLMHGVIRTSDVNLLTLGDSTSTGYLSTDIFETLSFAADTFPGNMSSWDGGTIEGPFRRWMTGTTSDQQSVFPLGKGNTKRTAGIHFQNTTPGYLTGTFKAMQPGVIGLPLTNEQNTNIGFVSPTGYWNFESGGTSGIYTIDVRATGFTKDGVKLITSLPDVRLIKRPSNASWQLSGSSTMAGPLSLNQVTSAGLNGFSDFGIGNACGNVVTTGSDDIVGSLRYVLDNCISSGDTVKFDSSLSLLIVTTDTIILDKNVTIYATSDDNINIQGSGIHSIMKVQSGKTVKLQNLELTTGNALDGRAIYNKGSLTINHITIHDIGTGNSTILNKGSLIVVGNNSLLKE
ncbi:MAG: M12 family metallo-peptidase, partial [Saprospiraceae bacterium]